MRFLLHYYVLLVAILTLLLYLTSLWLPGTGQNCTFSWQPCVNAASSKFPPAISTGSDVRSETDNTNLKTDLGSGANLSAECPGQRFQVSRLLFHLDSSLGPDSDVLLEPYLLCWEELLKFMDALGPLVVFFTDKVREKISLIRHLAEEDAGKLRLTIFSMSLPVQPFNHAYQSVRSMLETELQAGVVSFVSERPSGSRMLLRLHRSLLWLQLILEKLWLDPHQSGRSLGEVCDDAYSESLAAYHPWLLKQAARLAFSAMPDQTVLLHMVCVSSHKEAEPIIHTIVSAIKEVRRRTHKDLEKRNMLELP